MGVTVICVRCSKCGAMLNGKEVPLTASYARWCCPRCGALNRPLTEPGEKVIESGGVEAEEPEEGSVQIGEFTAAEKKKYGIA